MNIYAGNLSLETTADELRECFIPFGEVLSVTVMNDKYIGSGQLRGYGYIQMVSKHEGENAIAQLNGKIFKDRVLSVTEALPLTKYEIRIPKQGNKSRPGKKRERISTAKNNEPE